MEFSFKKVLASVSVAAISLTQAGVAFAAYSDVPSGVWYGDAVESFTDAGYLDATQPRFRGSEPANRAEFVKLVVELNGGILSTPPAVASFDDAAPGAWYYGYMEEAGKEGWVRGDGNCYGTHPCYARPGANINRAEAAALITRAFGLEETGDAPQFVDNPNGQWYTDVIQTAADHCVLQGDDSTGRVRPGDNMNRAEMVVMLHRVDQGLMYGVDCGDTTVLVPMITDVVATSATSVEVEFNMDLDEDAAADVMHYTITNGSELDINSAELLSEDVVELMLGEALDPNHEYTLTVEDMMTADGEEFSDSMDFGGYSPIVKGEGVLEVSLASSNPVGDTLPKGAVGVVMLSVDLTASCDDSVVLEDVTILHEGFGEESDIDGLYVAIDGARVSRKRTIDQEDQTASLRFSSPLVVDPCETVTLDIVADFVTTAATSAEHNLVLELASDVVSNALDVGGNFPLRGNTFRVAAVSSGTVTVEYRTVSPDQVEVGDTAVVIGKFEVSSNSVEDQTIYAMTLEQNSSASDGDFTNIAIRRTDGTVLTNTVASTVGDFVTLVFDPPFTVLEGDKITLEIIADIVGGAGDSVQMTFEESSDIFAVGSLYGYGVNGQLYGSRVTIDTDPAADVVSIDAGEFTIGINGPASEDYTRDDNDAVLANIRFQTGGERVDVKELFILVEGETSTGTSLDEATSGTITADGTADDDITEVLEDVELRNKTTGSSVSAVEVSGAFAKRGAVGSYQVYRFDDFIINGDENWEFRVDFIDNGAGSHPLSGDKFRIHICGEPTQVLDTSNSLTTNSTTCDFGGVLATGVTTYHMQVEGLSTGDAIGDVRPRGTISGNFHNIADASLTVSMQNLTSTNDAVENSKDISLMRFEMRAGEAEDILFTKAVFDEGAGNAQNIQNYTLWVDTDGDGEVDTILQDGVSNQSSTVAFTDLAGGGFVIPAEDTVIFEVHGDVSSSLSSPATLRLSFATGTTSFIEAEELDDGSNLSGIELNGSALFSATSTDIAVTTVASTLWSFANQGNLFVIEDSTPIRNRQLLGGVTSEPVLRLQFRAENEDIDVTDIQITSSGSNANSVDRLELYLADGTTPFAEATIGGCAGNALVVNPDDGYATVQSFCANMESRQFVVPEGQDTDVLVRARMKRDNQGGTSGQDISLFVWNSSGAIASGTGAIQARGAESSNDLTDNDGDATSDGEVFIGLNAPAASTHNSTILGTAHVSTMSKIASITNANPQADNTPVSTGIQPFGQFKFSASPNANSNNGLNYALLTGIIFNVNATNVILSDFKFYNKADATITDDCTVEDSSGANVSTASGSLLVSCTGLDDSSVQTRVDQGDEETFVLQANVTNAQVSASATSILQASLQSFSKNTRLTFGTGTVSDTANSHIIWQDTDSVTGTDFLWVEYADTVVNSTSYKS
jgi:hypothetical protein